MRRTARILAALAALIGAPVSAEVDDALIQSGKPARLLSAYGLFEDGARQVPAAGVHPYDLATPLFTDYAAKHRFVYVPEGAAAQYDPKEAFAFPVGAVLVKTFAYPGGTAGERLIETRLLIRAAAGWEAWAYLWDKDQSDAVLKIAGARLPLTITDPAGRRRDISYRVPNKNQCKGCHAVAGAVTPIGPKARNLNRSYAYEAGAQNQLAYWTAAGLLDGAPAPADAPAAPDWSDPAAPLAARARAYLDVNCAHCHRRDGPASNSGLFLAWGEADPRALGIAKRPVAAGRGSGGLPFDIAPGRPEDSILLYRMRSDDPAIRMPELGRSLAHAEAVALIETWIAAME